MKSGNFRLIILGNFQLMLTLRCTFSTAPVHCHRCDSKWQSTGATVHPSDCHEFAGVLFMVTKD